MRRAWQYNTRAVGGNESRIEHMVLACVTVSGVRTCVLVSICCCYRPYDFRTLAVLTVARPPASSCSFSPSDFSRIQLPKLTNLLTKFLTDV